LSLRLIPESALDVVDQAANKKSHLIEFFGMERLFTPIIRDHKLISEELHAITRRHHLIAANLVNPKIAVHVRLGDFSVTSDNLETARNVRLPLRWYVQVLGAIRATAGSNLEAVVFSDGSDQELRPLLSLPNVSRITTGSSISDLWAMSKSKILIASGSTFSMWASYLGRMPVIWHPGQLRQKLYPECEGLEFECGDVNRFPAAFTTKIRQMNHG
jgi:hypothetical protein